MRALGFVLIVSSILGIIVVVLRNQKPSKTPAPVETAAPVAPAETPAPVETAAPPETLDVVTPDTLYRFPKLYQDRRIQLVGWRWALVQAAKSAHLEGPVLPPDCTYVLIFSLDSPGRGCASTVPERLLIPYYKNIAQAKEEDIDLICTVERVIWGDLKLTHCELSPSNLRKMKDREYELETGKSPYPQPSGKTGTDGTDSKF